MTMNPVESTNVARIGFEAGVIRVQYRDGATYDYPASEQEYLVLLADPSKGRWIHANLKPRTGARVASEPKAAPTVNSFASDDCCGAAISKAMRRGDLDKATEWTCPKCSVPWHPDKISETHRHWSPEIAIAILRV